MEKTFRDRAEGARPFKQTKVAHGVRAASLVVFLVYAANFLHCLVDAEGIPFVYAPNRAPATGVAAQFPRHGEKERIVVPGQP